MLTLTEQKHGRSILRILRIVLGGCSATRCEHKFYLCHSLPTLTHFNRCNWFSLTNCRDFKGTTHMAILPLRMLQRALWTFRNHPPINDGLMKPDSYVGDLSAMRRGLVFVPTLQEPCAAWLCAYSLTLTGLTGLTDLLGCYIVILLYFPTCQVRVVRF